MKKRIALGVIAALAAGLLGAVAPATAAVPGNGTGTGTLAWYVDSAFTSSETTMTVASVVCVSATS